jgi:hypothetical protein
MKNLLTVAAPLLIMLFLTACSGITSVNPERLKLDKSYTFTANIDYGTQNAVAQFVRLSANSWEIVLTEPFALEGVKLSYENGEITTQFEEMDAIMSSGNVAEAIITAFESAIIGENRQAVSNGENIIISSKTGSLYELTLTKSDLQPLSMKIPAQNITVEFSGVQTAQIVPVLLPQD